MVQLGPKECLLQSGDNSVDAGKMRMVVNRSGVMVTNKKKGTYLISTCLVGFL